MTARPDFSLDDKVVMITGASRGLGRAMAAAMAGAGARLVLCGRDRNALEAQVAALGADGAAAREIAFDLRDRAAVEAAVRDVVQTEGRLDVLLNNAGLQHRQPLTELADDDWDRMVETNLTSCFRLARAAARHMVGRGEGRIINTASVMGPLARPTVAAYVATKGGLAALTRALAVELGPKGIACNAIAPGFFATDMTEALVADRDFAAYIEQRVPLGRWGAPEEVAGAAVFLASPAASYVNGHVLFVDGGLTAAL